MQAELNPSLSRRQARSRALHAAVAERLRTNPDAALAIARRHMRWLEQDPHAAYYFREWSRWLDAPVDALCALLTDPSEYAEDLRRCSPFTGLLTPAERWAIYRAHAPGHFDAPR